VTLCGPAEDLDLAPCLDPAALELDNRLVSVDRDGGLVFVDGQDGPRGLDGPPGPPGLPGQVIVQGAP
jgi:hypothetical protein